MKADFGGKKLDRDALIYIENDSIFRRNLKLVLLTANPMFNNSNENCMDIESVVIERRAIKLIDEKTVFQNDKLTDKPNNILKENQWVIFLIYKRKSCFISY